MRPLGNDIALGTVIETGKPLPLPREARATHLYIAGLTETGKSKFLESLIWQDLMRWNKSGCGALVIDPHGSLYNSLMARLAFNDIHLPRLPIVPVDLTRDDWIIGYNVLRPRPKAEASVVIGNFIQAMSFVWGASGTDMTPLFARWASRILRTLYEKKYTLVEAEYLTDLVSKELRQTLTEGVKTRSAKRDWAFADTLSAKDFDAQISSTLNRLERFLNTEVLRRMFGQDKLSLDLGEALAKGRIILVNLSLSGGRIHEEDARLFATLLLADLWTAAKERGKPVAGKTQRPFYVYLDEFQRFVSPTIAQNLDEARGFGLHLTLAHQFPKQLLNAGSHGQQVYDSIMANARNKVVFAMEDEDNLKPLAQMLYRGVMSPMKVKHQLYSTKVMSYAEELRTSYNTSTTASRSGAHQSGSAGGSGRGGTSVYPWGTFSAPSSTSDSTSQFQSQSQSDSSSWGEARVDGEAVSPMLLPQFGKELSSVQFFPLEEQLFRAMGALHDQAQRHFVTRLVGSRIPLAVRTPTVHPQPTTEEFVEKYTAKLFRRLSFALLCTEADHIIEKRDAKIAKLVSKDTPEPDEIRRPVKPKKRA
jgi:hypothetical protein